MRVKLITAGILVVLAGGVAAVATGAFSTRSAAYEYVPRDALALGHVALDPSLSQKRALQSLFERLPADAQERLVSAVPQQLDQVLGDAGLDFEEDVKPWLGDDVVVFGIADGKEMAAAALLATTDGETAIATLRSVMDDEAGAVADEAHRDVAYARAEEFAVAALGSYVAVGQVPAVQAAIDASIDGGIDGEPVFAELTGALEPDRLLTYWVDAPALLEHAPVMEGMTSEQRDEFAATSMLDLQQPIAGAVFVTSETVVLENSTRQDPDAAGLLASVPDDPNLLGAAPAEAWLAGVVPGVGDTLQVVLDQVGGQQGGLGRQANEQLEAQLGTSVEDVLAWMGDGSYFVAGGGVEELFGAISITSSDAQATSDLVGRLADAARQEGVPLRPVNAAGLEGYEIESPQVPVRAALLGGERLVVGAAAGGVDPSVLTAAIAGSGGTLADEATFTSATASLGEGVVPLLYVDAPRVVDVVRSAFGASSTPEGFTEAEPYLARLSYVIGGVRADGDRLLQRLVIGTTAE